MFLLTPICLCRGLGVGQDMQQEERRVLCHFQLYMYINKQLLVYTVIECVVLLPLHLAHLPHPSLLLVSLSLMLLRCSW